MDMFPVVAGAVSLVVAVAIAALSVRRARAATTRADRAVAEAAGRVAEADRRRDESTVAWRGAPFGVIALDPRGQVAFSNESAKQLLGARHGAAITELRIEQLVERTRGSGAPVHDVVEILVPVHRHVGITVVPVTGVGGISSVVYLEDLTRRVRVDAMRRDFLANVSHELKTPLGALSVLAETLEDETDPVARQRLAARLRSESARMAHLLADIMDLSLVESGESEREPLVVQEVVKAAVNQVEPVAHEKGVRIEVDLPLEELKLSGDARQLEAAVANLVDNAIRYSSVEHREGRGLVRISAGLEGGQMVVAVSDDGIGIATEHHDRIFERFYRVDSGRSRQTGGTGLGLAIVRHVARNHGGTVTVDSEPGSGATFRVRIPIEGG